LFCENRNVIQEGRECALNTKIDRRQLLIAARNFIVYYGKGQTNKLSNYDIAIVEPAGHDAQSVKKMQLLNTLVFAYVSITEIPDYDPFKKLLSTADYLTVNSEMIINEQYQTQIVNLLSNHWRNLLLHRIGTYLRVSGYDGIFMDTLSNVEWPSLPVGVQTEQQAAATEIIQKIHNQFPDHLILQNNGLESLCFATAPFIDGICWENPNFIQSETFTWHKKMRARMKNLADQHAIRVLLLQEKSTVTEPVAESVANWSKQEGFLHYVSPPHYLHV